MASKGRLIRLLSDRFWVGWPTLYFIDVSIFYKEKVIYDPQCMNNIAKLEYLMWNFRPYVSCINWKFGAYFLRFSAKRDIIVMVGFCGWDFHGVCTSFRAIAYLLSPKHNISEKKLYISSHKEARMIFLEKWLCVGFEVNFRLQICKIPASCKIFAVCQLIFLIVSAFARTCQMAHSALLVQPCTHS